MERSNWWYVLYVRTNTENRVIEEMKRFSEKLALPYTVEPFVLESEQYYRSKKFRQIGKSYQKRPMFPGYVFVDTDMPDKEFIACFSDYISKSEHIIRLLHSGNENDLAISDRERQTLEYLFLGKKCLEHSEGYISGEEIVITSGPLKGQEGKIRKINRHNRVAFVEIEFFNQIQLVKVALEIIEKRTV